MLYLSSEQILQMYNNTVNKEPEINQDMLCWAMKECDRTKTAKWGGIIFDKMTITTNIQFKTQGEGLRVFAVVDFGHNNNGIHQVLSSNDGFNTAANLTTVCISRLQWLPVPCVLHSQQENYCWANSLCFLGFGERFENLWFSYYLHLYGWCFY